MFFRDAFALDFRELSWYNLFEKGGDARRDLKRRKKMERKEYFISKIEGEYAYLLDKKSGEELFIAMALLPFGVDIGTSLSYENFEFTILD